MEEDLRDHLLSVLPEAAESGTDYFTNSDFNPHNLSIDSQTEALLHLAKESLSLRDELQLPKQGSVGELYLYACAEAADLNNVHRRGPHKLSAWVASVLEEHPLKRTE